MWPISIAMTLLGLILRHEYEYRYLSLKNYCECSNKVERAMHEQRELPCHNQSLFSAAERLQTVHCIKNTTLILTALLHSSYRGAKVGRTLIRLQRFLR